MDIDGCDALSPVAYSEEEDEEKEYGGEPETIPPVDDKYRREEYSENDGCEKERRHSHGVKQSSRYLLVSGTEKRVCRDIAKRQSLGISKYGTTVAQNPLELREWLKHAYEEVLDMSIYLRRAIDMIDSSSSAQSGNE